MGKLKRFLSKKTEGSVLFTVVAVMTVLIIVAMATLTIVNTSTRRTHESFAEDQAYLTARATLESTLACMQNYQFKSPTDNTLDSNPTSNKYYAFSKDVYDLASGNMSASSFTAKASITDGRSYETDVDMLFERVAENTVRITATARIGNMAESTASMVLKCNKPLPQSPFTNAVTTFGNASAQAGLTAFGGSSFMVGNRGTLELTNSKTPLTENTVINGDVYANNQQITIGGKTGEVQYLVIDGDLQIDNGVKLETAGTADDPHTIVFVKGKIGTTTSNKFMGYVDGDEHRPCAQKIDLYCDTVEFQGANDVAVNGDMYIFGDMDESEWIKLENNNRISTNAEHMYVSERSYNILKDLAGKKNGDNSPQYPNIKAFYEAKVTGADGKTEIPRLGTVSGKTGFKTIDEAYDGLVTTTPEEIKKNHDESLTVTSGNGKTITQLVTDKVITPSRDDPYNYGDWGSNGIVLKVNATTQDVKINLTDTTFYNGAKIEIEGNKRVDIYVNNGKNLDLKTGAYISNTEINNIVQSSDKKLNVATKDTTNESTHPQIKSPNIYYHLGDGATVLLDNTGCYLAGYINGPQADLKINGGAEGLSLTYKDDITELTVPNSVAVIGSAVVGSTSGRANGAGFIFVPDTNRSGGFDDSTKNWWQFQFYEVH